MDDNKDEQIIAERKLYLHGDTKAKVYIGVLRPRLRNSSDYDCDCFIENLVTGQRKKISAAGADSTQALLIALCFIGLEIGLLNKTEFNLKLVRTPESTSPSEDNCGFPVYDVDLQRTIFF